LDPAIVFLPGRDDPEHPSWKLSELPALGGRADDPVAQALRAALGDAGSSVLQPGPTKDACAERMVLPGSQARDCPNRSSRHPVTIDDDGQLVGVPVLAIPLKPPDNRQMANGQSPEITAATKAFVALLARDRSLLGLRPHDDAAADIVQHPVALMTFDHRQPVDVTIILDSSLSMGRVNDPGRYGARAPLGPVLDGLQTWSDALALTEADHLQIMVAQRGHRKNHPHLLALAALGDPARRPVAEGETGLKATLSKLRKQHRTGTAKTRNVTIFVTDGVNAFSEKPVPGAGELKALRTVVVDNARGCKDVPEAAQEQCLPKNSSDLAAELSKIMKAS
jgi:hypothetical protein